jgi:hypothetical protein
MTNPEINQLVYKLESLHISYKAMREIYEERIKHLEQLEKENSVLRTKLQAIKTLSGSPDNLPLIAEISSLEK